jgi:hypothetical protein
MSGPITGRDTFPSVPQLLAELQPVRIFNIWDEQWTVPKGGLGTFTVPACEDGTVCSKALEIPAILREAIPVGFDGESRRFEWRMYDGREIARDILDGMAGMPTGNNLTQYGVFLASARQPSGAEIEAARWALYRTCIRLVRDANDFWDGNAAANIGRMHQKAIRYVESYTPAWRK